MRCPYCSDAVNKVIDSRLGRDGAEIRRRRECLECGRRFTTRERVEEILPKVIKQDGRREEFQREKLIVAIGKACQKRSVSADDVERLVDRLERVAQDLGQKEIESSWLGERAMDELVRLDPLAAARFASVFRDFQNAGGLRRLLRFPLRLEARARKAEMTPEAAMRQALACAKRARGRSFPNPPVGAVVFRGDRVLGRGATRNVGGPHAEVVAIRGALRRHGASGVRGASIAVTLEPCNHHGRTAPCSELLVEAGLSRVLVGHVDPHPTVSGRGLARLRRAGLEVTLGVLEAECRAQHRGFLSVCARGRPFVALKLASSLDGRIATASGESRWITGEAARSLVHRLRAQRRRRDGRLGHRARRRSRAQRAPRRSRAAAAAAHPRRFGAARAAGRAPLPGRRRRNLGTLLAPGPPPRAGVASRRAGRV